MSAVFSGSSWGLGELFSDEQAIGVLVFGEVVPGKRRFQQGGIDSQCDIRYRKAIFFLTPLFARC
jgi:hypothetical protein